MNNDNENNNSDDLVQKLYAELIKENPDICVGIQSKETRQKLRRMREEREIERLKFYEEKEKQEMKCLKDAYLVTARKSKDISD